MPKLTEKKIIIFSRRADIAIRVSSVDGVYYDFACRTVTDNFLYHVHCEPHHGMRMLRVAEEATKECLQAIETFGYGVREQFFI